MFAGHGPQEILLFSAKASIYRLEDGNWLERGVGGILGLTTTPRRDELNMHWTKALVNLNYVLHPGKIKTSGPRAWVVKAEKQDDSEIVIIAVRFVADDKSEQFAEIYQRLADAEDMGGEGPHDGDDMERPWNCNMCTYTNDGGSRSCDMCGTSRVGHRDSDDSQYDDDADPDADADDEVNPYVQRVREDSPWRCAACTYENPANYTRCDMCGRNRQGGNPQDSRPSEPFHHHHPRDSDASASSFDAFGSAVHRYGPAGGGAIGIGGGMPPPVPPRVGNETWECPSCTLQNAPYDPVCAACGASPAGRVYSPSVQSSRSLFDSRHNDHSGPNEDLARQNFLNHLGHRDRRMQSTKVDFQIAASHVASAPNYDPQVFTTLKSVARKLLKDDPRYRCLDASNRKVREKLVGYEGVLDFLELLGFESDAFGTKLMCHEQPLPHVVNDAIEILDTYLEDRPHFDASGGPQPPPRRQSGRRSSGGGDAPHVEGGGMQTGDFGGQLLGQTAGGGGGREPQETKQDADQFTLEQIVLWVTQPSQRERENEDVLIMCYFTIANPAILVTALRDRYFSVPIPQGLSDEEEKAFIKTDQRPVQLKVGNMLKNWLKSFWREDFKDNPSSQAQVEQFLEEMSLQEDNFNTSLARAIRNLFDRLREEPFEVIPLETRYDDVRVNQNKLVKIIGSKSCDEIADQLTLMDFYIFHRIQPRECLGQAWKKKDRMIRAPNILAMIAQFNNLVKWVQIQILSEKSLRDRGRAIKRVIKMGERFRINQNFNSLCAIFSALNAACIHRLKLAWERVPPKQQKAFDEFKVIFARDKNQKNLRTLLRQAAAPSIPHIGIFLQDLVFIDDGNKTRKQLRLNLDQEDAQIFNFDKARRLAERIKTISLYQQRPYDIQEDRVVQKILWDEMLKLKEMTEDEIWEMSTVIKKSDEKDAKSWL